MKCAVNRWGPGTTCEKPKETQATKELEARITKMNEERAMQDSIWTPSPLKEKEMEKKSQYN